MIAEACGYFGWTLHDCLKMPARAFFALVKEGRRNSLIDKIESCDIAAITVCDTDWYKNIRGGFASRLEELNGVERNEVPSEIKPKKISEANEPLQGEQARQAMFTVLTAAKRYT